MNRITIVVVLIFVLPAVTILGRVSPRHGRRLAVMTIRLLAQACGVRVSVSGTTALPADDSYLLVPNHSSPADIAALLIARPDLRFVAAAELFRIPLLGSAMRALGTEPISRRDPGRSHSQISELAQPVPGRKLVMFAEGGISPTDEVMPFKSGAFVVAIQTAAPVVPVAVTGSAAVLPRGARLKVRPGRIHVEFLPFVPTAGLSLRSRHDLAASVRESVSAAVRHRQAVA